MFPKYVTQVSASFSDIADRKIGKDIISLCGYRVSQLPAFTASGGLWARATLKT